MDNKEVVPGFRGYGETRTNSRSSLLRHKCMEDDSIDTAVK